MKIRSASIIFLISYVSIGVVYFLAFLLTPTVQNAGSLFVLTVLGWPYVPCVGLLSVNLPIVALMTFVAILVSLVLQAQILRDQYKAFSGHEQSRISKTPTGRLRLILWLQGFLAISIVVAPLERTFWPVSLLMWASTWLPLAVWAKNSRKTQNKAKINKNVDI